MKQAKKWMQSALEKFAHAQQAIEYFEGILDEDGHLEQDIAVAKYALENKSEIEKWFEDRDLVQFETLKELCEENRIKMRALKGIEAESLCSDIARKLHKEFPTYNNNYDVTEYYKNLTTEQWAAKEPKVIRSFRLDTEVIKYYEKKAEQTGISINALINSALLQIARGSK